MKMENVYFIGMILFFCTTILYFSKARNLKADLKISKDLREMDFDYYRETRKKLTNYVLVSIELNNICDKFQSSRNAKAKNETLQQLLKEIN